MTDYIQNEMLEGDASASFSVDFEARRAINNEQHAASGFVHFGKHYSGAPNFIPVNQGLWTRTVEPSILALGRQTEATAMGDSKTDYPVVNIAGNISKLIELNSTAIAAYFNSIKFPAAPDGTVTYDSATGTIVQHADAATAFAAETATNKVVTDRVDMYGLEGFLEEVNATNPYIYPNGLIQSQATTMNGIATGASNRPDTYYAVFTGDTTSKGKGVDYFALSEAHKIKVLSDPDNNLYRLDDGRLVQWRIRQRTIAGAGNGDWNNVVTSSQAGLLFDSANVSTIVPTQGTYDTQPSPSTGNYFVPFGHSYWSGDEELGHYKATSFGSQWGGAVNGECYFLVLGTVSRLNQGAYHPSFNPSGSRLLTNEYSSQATSAFWHNVNGTTASYVTSTANLFDPNVYNTSSGYIGNPYPAFDARPDGRLYDAIYADGLGGVVDYRWSAFVKSSSEEASKVRQAVKNGSYRGLEKLGFTKVGTVTATGSVFNDGYTKLISTGQYYSSEFTEWSDLSASAGSVDLEGCFIIGDGGTVYPVGSYLIKLGNSATTYVSKTAGNVASDFTGGTYHIFIMRELDTSVSGNFSTTDVIGDPANILATTALANGWDGRWIPVIPDGVNGNWPWARKRIDPSATTPRIFTTDNGTTWNAAGTINTNSITNEGEGQAYATGHVQLVHYTAFAKQTKPANNAVVLNGESGLGDVFSSSSYLSTFGCTFGESLLGKILKSSVDRMVYDDKLVGQYIALNSGKLLTTTEYPTEHHPIALTAPTNDSSAFKTLMYQVDSNSQASLNFAYKEMIYDVTWGDDNKIDIADGDNTKTDLNGNTVQFGTHELAIPYGWIKNEV